MLSSHEFFRKINYCKLYFKYLRYLKGKSGLEIGGPSEKFKKTGILPVYPIVANLDCCNFARTTVWQGALKEGMNYRYDENKEKGYQFICDATDLGIIESERYDFILASHVIEHIANPLKAISEWLRVLKKKGIMLMIIPHKDRTFDHKRSPISLEHLIEDFKKNIEEDDLTHLSEILELHDLKLDPPAGDYESFKKRSLTNYENRCLHHHVLNSELVIEIFDYFGLRMLSVDMVLPSNIIIMGKKYA